jgi:hypothetical protein
MFQTLLHKNESPTQSFESVISLWNFVTRFTLKELEERHSDTWDYVITQVSLIDSFVQASDARKFKVNVKPQMSISLTPGIASGKRGSRASLAYQSLPSLVIFSFSSRRFHGWTTRLYHRDIPCVNPILGGKHRFPELVVCFVPLPSTIWVRGISSFAQPNVPTASTNRLVMVFGIDGARKWSFRMIKEYFLRWHIIV